MALFDLHKRRINYLRISVTDRCNLRCLYCVPGLVEISLTTNGILLKDFARPLHEAGIRRINISLDTLDPVRFLRITRQLKILFQQALHAKPAGHAIRPDDLAGLSRSMSAIGG